MKKLCSVIILLSFFVLFCQGNVNDKKFKQDIVKANISEIKEKPVTDEDLKKTQKWLKGLGENYSINQLRKLKLLILCQTKITDAGLAHLKSLTNLQTLDLRRTKVSDAGLAHLKPLSNLQNLSLMETKVSDAGLAHLKSLTNLQKLHLSVTKISGIM